MPELPKAKKGDFIEFRQKNRKLRGEVYRVSLKDDKFQYHVLVNEYNGDQWTVQHNQVLRVISEEEYKAGFTPSPNFAEDRTRMMNEPEPSLDGRGRSKGGRSKGGRSKVRKGDKKKKSPSRYNLFVKKNFKTCGGDFKKIAEMWKKHKNDE